jgi:hypothetical protein
MPHPADKGKASHLISDLIVHFYNVAVRRKRIAYDALEISYLFLPFLFDRSYELHDIMMLARS